MIDVAILTLTPRLGVRRACEAVGAGQAGYYRRHRRTPAPPQPAPVPHRERHQPRALSTDERQAILGVLHSDRFVDLAPAEVWATLLDEEVYLGSQSTFYRLLREASGTRERRRQATHPAAVKPELVACVPNQVYSWSGSRGHRSPRLPQIPLCEDQHNGMYVQSLVMLRTLPAGRESPCAMRVRR